MPFIDQTSSTTVTIANGETISGAATLTGETLVAVRTPAALTGTALTFQVSDDGATYVPLYDDSAAYSVAAGASRGIPVKYELFMPWDYVKVVSAAAEGGARVITLVKRPL
jgi:hypothetical protein